MSVCRMSGLVAALALSASPAAAEPLLITGVAAPAVNCVFNPSCTITVTDTVGAIAIRAGLGSAVLQSRSFAGAPRTLAAGMTGYLFRIDLTRATGGTPNVRIARLKLDLGPLAKLPYPGGAGPAEVFVVTTGAVGTVGLASADRAGATVSFAFREPVCPGPHANPGQSSYFFGFAAAGTPQPTAARLEFDIGDGVDVPTRAPAP